jgi:hypothetical protein
MEDLTIIYLTASQIPKKFADRQRDILKKASKGARIISVSREPLDYGDNIIDDRPKSLSNIYWQMLRASKMATTPFVAVAEDDCLYDENHFSFYRPNSDTFAYNQNRFALFTWGEPMYSWRNRKSNSTLIAPRQLLIDTLEERFAKYPDGTPEEITGEVGRRMVESNLKVTPRKSKEVFSEVSVIQFNHDNASEDRQVRHRKKHGQIKAYDLYYWREAKKLIQIYEK